MLSPTLEGLELELLRSAAAVSGHMGLFHVGCTIVNPRTSKAVTVPRVMVDTGAESTWIAQDLLERVKIAPRKKDVRFQMANGQVITRRAARQRGSARR